MFSTELSGYNKKEVDRYISRLKSEYEKALMDARIKVLEAEKKSIEISKKEADMENKKKQLIKALEAYKKLQAESGKNIAVLKDEQFKMIYMNLQKFMQELNERYPGVLINTSYKRLLNDIEQILDKSEEKTEASIKTGTANDPMRVLLNKMQEKKGQSIPKEVKIERLDKVVHEKPSQIKPVVSMELNEDDDYDNLVDKFLNTKPEEEQPKAMKIQSNGFDLKEAVNPKDDLDEIMKAFDFYSDDNKANPDDYDF